MNDTPIIEDCEKVIFSKILNREDYELTESEATMQDMPEAFAVVSSPRANAGIIVYAKYDGAWRPNPFSCRFLVRELIEQLTLSKQQLPK